MTRPGSAMPVNTDLRPSKYYIENEPERYRDQKYMQDLVYNQDFEEQRQVIRQLNKIKKGATDSNEPEVYKRIDKLSINKAAKANKHE